MTDPNPLVAGKGTEILRSHGIEVQTGLLEKEAIYLNRVFLKYMTTRKPWVVFKSAVTLDGRIAAASGDSRWVSSEESRRLAHGLRGQCTAVLAGIGTVLADNPMLNCRLEGMRQPVRVIADSYASLPLDSALALTAKDYRTIVAHTSEAGVERLEALRGLGVETLECTASAGRVDIRNLLERLGEAGFSSVLVEGGAELNWSLISEDCVDEYYVFMAPKIIGGRAAKGFVGGDGFALMSQAVPVSVESVSPSGCDWMIHGFASKHSELCSRE